MPEGDFSRELRPEAVAKRVWNKLVPVLEPPPAHFEPWENLSGAQRELLTQKIEELIAEDAIKPGRILI